MDGNLLQIASFVMGLIGLISVIFWRSGRIEAGINKSISALAVIIEQKDAKAGELLHSELAKVYADINDVRSKLHELQILLSEKYLKKEEITEMVKEGNASLSREIINVETHIQNSLDRYLKEIGRND